MVIDMNDKALKTVAQVRAFLNGTEAVQFEPIGEDHERYAFIAAVLTRLGYRPPPAARQGRRDALSALYHRLFTRPGQTPGASRTRR